MSSLRLKPKIYLKEKNTTHLTLFFTVLSEGSSLSLLNPNPPAIIGESGEIIYTLNFHEDPGGPMEISGIIDDVEATRFVNKKIVLIARGDHEHLPGDIELDNHDGTGVGNSGDADPP